jgi:hypothetical protein
VSELFKNNASQAIDPCVDEGDFPTISGNSSKVYSVPVAPKPVLPPTPIVIRWPGPRWKRPKTSKTSFCILQAGRSQNEAEIARNARNPDMLVSISELSPHPGDNSCMDAMKKRLSVSGSADRCSNPLPPATFSLDPRQSEGLFLGQHGN